MWDELTSQLARTPRRATIESDSQKRVSEDKVTQALGNFTDRDYTEVMKGVGEPINLASTIFPAIRGLKAGKAVSKSRKVTAATQSARGVAEGVALGNLGLAIEDPNATWAQHVQTSKDMLVMSLGMIGGGVAIKNARPVMKKVVSAVKDVVPKRKVISGGKGEAKTQPAPFPVRYSEAPENETSRSSSPDAKSVSDAKKELADRGFSPVLVLEFIDRFYRRQNYAGLGGPNTVWLVMPSTSGKNTIPRALADRLAKDHGGIVVDGSIKTTHKTERKKLRGYIEKAESPSSYEVKETVAEKLRGMKVVIVDDILTTGDTVDALNRALVKKGVKAESVATIAAVRGGRLADAKNLAGLAELLAAATKRPLAEVRADVDLVLGQSRDKMVSNALEDAQKQPAKVYELISRQAQDIRKSLP